MFIYRKLYKTTSTTITIKAPYCPNVKPHVCLFSLPWWHQRMGLKMYHLNHLVFFFSTMTKDGAWDNCLKPQVCIFSFSSHCTSLYNQTAHMAITVTTTTNTHHWLHEADTNPDHNAGPNTNGTVEWGTEEGEQMSTTVGIWDEFATSWNLDIKKTSIFLYSTYKYLLIGVLMWHVHGTRIGITTTGWSLCSNMFNSNNGNTILAIYTQYG